MQNVKKEDAKTKHEFLGWRQTVKVLLPNCHLLKATWVLTLEIAEGKNYYSFHTVLKIIAKKLQKRDSAIILEKTVTIIKHGFGSMHDSLGVVNWAATAINWESVCFSIQLPLCCFVKNV